MVPIRHDGPDNVETIGQFKCFSHDFLSRYMAAVSIGRDVFSPGLIPQTAEWGTAVDAQVRPLGNDHRPRVDVDAMAIVAALEAREG
jgi:hypothetical protein